MKYVVRWANAAVSDLAQIRVWTEETRSSAEAVRIINHLARSALSLADMPGRGRPGRLTGTRELVVPPFVIAYRVGRNSRDIEILRILHGARNWPR
jgi:toxin ParE1/3/4